MAAPNKKDRQSEAPPTIKGERVRAARARLGKILSKERGESVTYRQIDLAYEAAIYPQQLSNVETNEREVLCNFAARIAPLLRVSTDYLFALADTPEPVSELVARIKELEKRIAELEGRRAKRKK